MVNRITLINRALLRIGAQPLQSEDAPNAPIYLAVYDSVMERISVHPFWFLLTTRQLTRLSAAPPVGWLYAYQMPAEITGAPRAVYTDPKSLNVTTSYDLEGDKLYANDAQIWLTFMQIEATGRWPGDFRELVTVAMMAEFALSVREDRTLHDRLYAKAWGTPSEQGTGGLLASALDNASQATPSTIVGDGVNPLIDVRHGFGTPG